MKTIYWRPQRTAPSVLLVIGLVSIIGLAGVYWVARAGHADVREITAARLAGQCFQAIKIRRLALGHELDGRFDPHQTGMIGDPISAATSKVANLSAKQVSVNPNFAAAIVRMFVEAGVEPGETIAVGWTGSFPALNVALCAAIETMELQPIVVSSVLSSQYGANLDDFMWLDMEQHLADLRLIHFRSAAMTIGGAADRAFRQSAEAETVAHQAHLRTGVAWLEADRLLDSIDMRMKLYHCVKGETPIAAYVNVGGGIASMGGAETTNLRAGVNLSVRSVHNMPDCVARRFAEQGKPVIHLVQAKTLATRYGLNTDLERMAIAGVGPAFEGSRPSRLLAAALLLAIAGSLHAFVSRDYGYRLLDWVAAKLPFTTRSKELRVVRSELMA